MTSPEGKCDKEFETTSPYVEEAIKEEYSRLTEKHYRGSLELRYQINTSKWCRHFYSKINWTWYNKLMGEKF